MKEALEIVSYSLKQIKMMVQLFDSFQTTLPLFSNLFSNNQVKPFSIEQEIIQIQKLIIINILHIYAKYSSTRGEIINLILQGMVQSATRIPKAILFFCKIFNEIYKRGGLEGAI